MKILDKNTGEWKTIQLGGGTIDYDSLPVGSIIDFDGDEIPAGYELSEDGTDGGTWIGDDTPTNAYNLWIEPSEEINSATEVVNTLNGNEVNLAPSVKVVNDIVNYSKKETVIGKWIDGKPIYRKVIDRNGSFDSFDHGISDVENIWINNDYTFRKHNSGNIISLNANSSGTYIYANNKTVTITNGGGVSAPIVFVTLEYTKTTD